MYTITIDMNHAEIWSLRPLVIRCTGAAVRVWTKQLGRPGTRIVAVGSQPVTGPTNLPRALFGRARGGGYTITVPTGAYTYDDENKELRIEGVTIHVVSPDGHDGTLAERLRAALGSAKA